VKLTKKLLDITRVSSSILRAPAQMGPESPRTVTENGRTLKFSQQGFEKD
jgi:hypothetical protein